MGAFFSHTIGAARAKVGVGLMNLSYNLSRIKSLSVNNIHTQLYLSERHDRCGQVV